MPRHDPRIDAYISRSAAFARPVLEHFRSLVHATVPDVEESVKWSMPFFTKNDTNICHMAAFKAHCAIGFWHPDVQQAIKRDGKAHDDAMGILGRITALSDVPSDRILTKYIRLGAALADKRVPARPRASRKPRPEPSIPKDLAEHLANDGAAKAAFENFSPSHRREYIEWIAEAKRPETRAARIATTIAWLRAGKSRNWKYERR